MGSRADPRYVNPRLAVDHRMYSPVHGRGHVNEDYYTQSSDSALSTSKEGNCLTWLKYGIFAANIVFMISVQWVPGFCCLKSVVMLVIQLSFKVVGSLLLAMGVWLRTDSRFRDFLSERYRQAVEEAFWEAPTLYAFSYIIIVLGCCMIVVAFFGESSMPSFHGYSQLDQFRNRFHFDKESLDHLQTTFRCCGNAGCSDFRAFRQDPPRSCDIRCDGCHYRIWVALSIGFSITLVVFFAVIICQVLALVFALYLVFTQPARVRLVYVDRPKPEPTLTRETLQRHNLPYDLRKDRHRKYY
ncbi:tetraspanin family protein [Ancylostoma caninum]|uniref:Tetraspanin family protein n=1 Tax=Ancylostoma caninum TaxID=29170 RepID=A0A368FRI3_ANCCA|nr:tetraspanin family protein [Ancylostoma caninum]